MNEQHIYDTAGGDGQQAVQEAIYEEFPEEKLKMAADDGRPPAGSLYEAIYDYEGQADGDLTFKAGDIIEVKFHYMYCNIFMIFLVFSNR